MPAPPIRYCGRCAYCGHTEQLSQGQVVDRLRGLGMLKRENRGDTKGDANLLLQLADAARQQLTCSQCGKGGLRIELASDDGWDAPSKACAACGAAIPPERAELFPNSDLCAACQSRVEQGQSPDKHDEFCPRCGSRMIAAQRGRAGVSRYEMVCPDCRR